MLLAASIAAAGCAGGAWKQALREDSPAAYYRFMRDHPGSRHVERAQERLDFHQLVRSPTVAGYDAFREQYPKSKLLRKLAPVVEERAFQRARARGTADGYRDFLEHFPDGALAERARGNAAYLAAAGFGGRADELRRFAAEHPESDFAAEAKRSSEGSDLATRSRFARVGLVIDISPATPEAERLEETFRARALETYADAGLELVPIPEIVSPDVGETLPRARLTISHDESAVATSVSGNEISRPGIVARTRVALRANSGELVFEREHTLRIDPQDALRDTSLLFGPRGPGYWREFFVPTATWASRAAIRPPVAFPEKVVAVDAHQSRAVLLFADGGFQMLELADPLAPLGIAEYERPRDLTKWSGVRILGDRVVTFGQDGVEIVSVESGAPQLVKAFGRDEIGTVLTLEPHADGLLLAGSRGLLLLDPESGELSRIMRRVIYGITSVGETLVFSDGESLFLSTLAQLREQRVLSQMRLGKAFGGSVRLRAFGPRVVVMGEHHVVVFDVSDSAKPVPVAQLPASDVGKIRDAGQAGGRIFLLGDRGLLILGRDGRVVDLVDVHARSALVPMGRHLLAIGGDGLQVVDATPFSALAGAAASGGASR